MSKQIKEIYLGDGEVERLKKQSLEFEETELRLKMVIKKVRDMVPYVLYKELEDVMSQNQLEWHINGYEIGFKQGIKLMTEALK